MVLAHSLGTTFRSPGNTNSLWIIHFYNNLCNTDCLYSMFWHLLYSAVLSPQRLQIFYSHMITGMLIKRKGRLWQKKVVKAQQQQLKHQQLEQTKPTDGGIGTVTTIIQQVQQLTTELAKTTLRGSRIGCRATLCCMRRGPLSSCSAVKQQANKTSSKQEDPRP